MSGEMIATFAEETQNANFLWTCISNNIPTIVTALTLSAGLGGYFGWLTATVKRSDRESQRPRHYLKASTGNVVDIDELSEEIANSDSSTSRLLLVKLQDRTGSHQDKNPLRMDQDS